MQQPCNPTTIQPQQHSHATVQQCNQRSDANVQLCCRATTQLGHYIESAHLLPMPLRGKKLLTSPDSLAPSTTLKQESGMAVVPNASGV